MSNAPRILAFAGSARQESFNKKVVRIAAAGAEKAGAVVTRIDLAEYPMPLYDADAEAREGRPEAAGRFQDLLLSHDGFLIASPEYNSSISPLLKNTLDWASRSADARGDLSAYRGKTAALMSASPGPLGGLRGLVHLRAMLSNIGVLVLPEQKTVRQATNAFDGNGNLVDAKLQQAVEGLGARLAEVLRKLL